MKLAIFDVDGTLTLTNAVDGRCFLQALREVLGVADPDADWSTYADVTDSAIFADVFSSAHGRSPTASDVQRFVARFLALLVDAHRADPADFREVSGAAAFLDRLGAEGWDLAIATGGFGASARQKLMLAGIDTGDTPLASADDSRSRERIVTLARESARRHAGVESFDRIVLVGDADWDRRTATTLRLPFVQVTTPAGHAEVPTLSSDVASIEAFVDQAAALHALDQATVPQLADETRSHQIRRESRNARQ
jgi:phosphoglycolate phosphatase-like HAD superfamily hydrolase